MNLSGEYVAKLKRRALSFLKEAEEAVDPDLAACFAEQSMQLYLKAVLYELFGEIVRGYRLRALLGLLSRGLERTVILDWPLKFGDLSTSIAENSSSARSIHWGKIWRFKLFSRRCRFLDKCCKGLEDTVR